MKIDGRKIAGDILHNLATSTEQLKLKGIIPHLVIIQIGNDPASDSYINQKEVRASEIGAKVTTQNYEAGIANQELFDKIETLNNDSTVHGIIVQRPVPTQIDNDRLNIAIDSKKDVDGFHPSSPFEAPIALAVMEILDREGVKLEGKTVTVVGKGLAGGAPIIKTLKKRGVRPQVIDSQTTNSDDLLKNSDIVISAVGKANIITRENIKEGSILISLGMHKEEDGKFHGDYEESEVEQKAHLYTPTPGGVGPVNVACLLQNLVQSAAKAT